MNAPMTNISLQHSIDPHHHRVILSLKDSQTGEPITEDMLETTHTRKLHLFVVDKGLRDYQHVHPVEIDTPGNYAFEFTAHEPQPI